MRSITYVDDLITVVNDLVLDSNKFNINNISFNEDQILFLISIDTRIKLTQISSCSVI